MRYPDSNVIFMSNKSSILGEKKREKKSNAMENIYKKQCSAYLKVK